MFQKIVNGAALLSLVLSGGLAGGAYFGFQYVKSPQFQTKVKNMIMGDLQKGLPSAINKQMPGSTGPAMPFQR